MMYKIQDIAVEEKKQHYNKMISEDEIPIPLRIHLVYDPLKQGLAERRTQICILAL